MRIVISGLLAWFLAGAGQACAENIMLKDGRQLEAVTITPGKVFLRVVTETDWTDLRKKELTPEQVARYFGGEEGKYLTFETRKMSDKVEYAYYFNGKYAGLRVADMDGALLRSEGNVPDGVYREFSADDTLLKEMVMAEGRQNGLFQCFYPGGGVQSEMYYYNGKPHGLRRVFDKDGTLVSEERFNMGRRESQGVANQTVKPAAVNKPAARKKS